MEQIRTRFLERQLGAILPREVIAIVRDYDAIYRDYFSAKIVANLNSEVNDFWENKMIDFTQNLDRYWDHNYKTKIQNYYTILWNVLTIPIKYGGCKCGNEVCATAEGLLMLD